MLGAAVGPRLVLLLVLSVAAAGRAQNTPTPVGPPTPPAPLFEGVEARPNPARPGATVFLDGERSRGPMVSWRQRIGPPVVLSPSGQSATFVAPTVHRSSTMSFDLRICSPFGAGQLRCESRLVLVQIEPEPICVGDCDGNGQVAIQELVRIVSIALNQTEIGFCRAVDRRLDSVAQIDELVEAVNRALRGCPVPTEIPRSPTATDGPALTCTPTETPPAIPYTPTTTPSPAEFPIPGCCEFNTGECEDQAGAMILTCIPGHTDGRFGRFFSFGTCHKETGRCLTPTPTPACATHGESG